MRRLAVIALFSFVVASCSSGATTASDATSTISATTTTLATTPTSTVALTTTTDSPSDAASGRTPQLDRSILGLALVTGDTGPGRFRLERGPNTETLMTVEGRYWVTDQGNVYTALDVDTGLIAEQMELLAASVEATGGQPVASPYLTSLHEHYRGDEFQIGLTDLVRSLALGGLPAEWAEQWTWFVQADGNEVPPELVACNDAVASLDEAARRWVHDLEVEFVNGTWAFPVEGFEEALAAEIEEASICELFVEVPGQSPEIVFRVGGAPERPRIEVLVDTKIYTDRKPELMFAVEMWPDESVGPPPSNPNPLPLLTLRGSYLTAIGVCGELPWIYSDFAASHSYSEPGSGDYTGPLVFASGWYCQDEVPDEHREV